jgi:hypothetical protein
VKERASSQSHLRNPKRMCRLSKSKLQVGNMELFRRTSCSSSIIIFRLIKAKKYREGLWKSTTRSCVQIDAKLLKIGVQTSLGETERDER